MTDMQPENSRPVVGPEQAPTDVTQNRERIPVLPTPETGIETGAERFEQTAEASAAAADTAISGIPIMPPVIPAPLPPPPVVPIDDNPLVAADEDVIEKEWVDKAKKIILETKDDPYGRTTRVNELQQDYIRKRYNKELGSSS